MGTDLAVPLTYVTRVNCYIFGKCVEISGMVENLAEFLALSV